MSHIFLLHPVRVERGVPMGKREPSADEPEQDPRKTSWSATRHPAIVAVAVIVVVLVRALTSDGFAPPGARGLTCALF
jgi:hypothetical protein